MTDRVYLARVRELPCCVCEMNAGIEAHHRTGAGLAIKADDHDTMPLCGVHHRDFHDARGMFRNWDKELRKTWQNVMIAWTQRRLGAAEHEAANG